MLGITAWVMSFLWENLHAGLYKDFAPQMAKLAYLGCSLADVVLVLIIWKTTAWLLHNPTWGRQATRMSYSVATIVAATLSYFAEKTSLLLNLWRYTDKMPLVPLLGIGLSPWLAIIVIPLSSFIIADRLYLQNKLQ